MATTLIAVIRLASGHGSLLFPVPRGGVDKTLPEFANGTWPKGHYMCECSNSSNTYCHPGQSCLWFNQGCTIGCPCTGNGTESRIPNFNTCNTTMRATNNDVRTLNREAQAGSPSDVYKFMPWRAPGSAVLVDPCGVAGGSPIKQGNGGEYYPTKFAKQGDLGSEALEPLDSGAVWRAGETVQTSIFIQANHAGGWQFRLCPASEPLTEECFQRHPVPFDQTAGQMLRLSDGSLHQINATYLDEGVSPAGSAWVMNPVPECCPPGGVCERNGVMCGSSAKSEVGKKCYNHQCGVDGGLGPSVPEFLWPTTSSLAPPSNTHPKFGIVDTLILPADLTPGKWVLGWRWDAEETAQVWNACSDITITS